MVSLTDPLPLGLGVLGQGGGSQVFWVLTTALAGAVAIVCAAWAWGHLRVRRSLESRVHDLETMLSHTDALIWEATVIQEENDLHWEFSMQPSKLTDRLFPQLRTGWRISLWRDMNVPEMDEMNVRSRAALESGAEGYDQELRVPQPDGSMRWMHESVAIQRRGNGRYWLVGLVTDITAEKEAEIRRLETERSLQETLDRASCLLWRAKVVRRGDQFEWMNFDMPKSALYPDLFGDRPASMGGKLWSLVNCPGLDEMNARSTAALREGIPGYEQTFMVRNDEGRAFWLHEQVSINRLGGGEMHLVGVITDITERRRAEQAVRLSEQRYKTLFEHMPVAIVEADFSAVGEWMDRLRAEGVTDLGAYLSEHPRESSRAAMRVRVLGANEAARVTIGAKGIQELRWRRAMFETDSSRRAMKDTFVKIWQGNNRHETELEVRRLDGEVRQTAMRWWVAKTDDGLDLSQAVMIYVDMSELKQAERNLAAQREQLAVTLRAMKECVVTADRDGRVQFVNSAAAEFAGLVEGLGLSRRLEDLFNFFDHRSEQNIVLPVAEVLRGDRVVDLPAHAALRNASDRIRHVEGQVTPVHGADSEVVGVVLVFRDITDRERLEQEMVRATRLESVGVLAGGIAHDFNNILTAVVGNLSIAQMDTRPDTSEGRAVREAERAALRAKDLTQQLLTFAKGGEPVREAVRLGGVIRDMTEFALHGSPVGAVFELDPDLWLADVDKGQVGRVVQNLVLNAAQAMPRGGNVTIGARNVRVRDDEVPELAAGRYVCIDVRDTGEGIKPEHVSLVFDPYFSTKQTGSGLGLSAAYSIVRKHGGVIDVRSRLGAGTQFRIWLPVADGEEAVEEQKVADTAIESGHRILFMDDDSAIREMAVKLLGRLGMKVTTTTHGEEMVEAFREAHQAGKPFDLVITDLTVPGAMGRREALPELQAIDPKVRVVVSSGYSSDPILADYLSHGFWNRVGKPYRVEELRRILHEAFPGQKAPDAGGA